MHHGLTRNDVMQFAYELAVQNNLKFPNSWNQHKQAGLDWLYDDDFLASAVTERPPPVHQITNRAVGIPTQQVSIETAETVTQPISDETAEMTPQQVANEMTEVIPTTTEFQFPSCSTSSEVPPTSSCLVSPERIRPYPRAEATTEGKGKNRKRKSEILTNTPIEDAIIADLEMKNEKKY
ncbi:hypothetical protein JTB14_004836 [Gonioctena quinquepunctata]|nr:hypothetical protein JTB14_004836 [Gonioctena quinquepunctata]